MTIKVVRALVSQDTIQVVSKSAESQVVLLKIHFDLVDDRDCFVIDLWVLVLELLEIILDSLQE